MSVGEVQAAAKLAMLNIDKINEDNALIGEMPIETPRAGA